MEVIAGGKKSPVNPVLKSIQPILENSKHVRINKVKLREFSKAFADSGTKHWMDSSPISLSSLDDSERLNFLFVFNSISFSYWGDPKWFVTYEGKSYERGTWCMLASLKRAIDEGKPILYPHYLANITKEELGEILRANVEIPLLERRSGILREMGKIVSRDYGDFDAIVRNANGDVLRLLEILVGDFPSFSDCSTYDGKTVCFHKRAQLLISDIIHSFPDQYGLQVNLGELTACADYILPMVLRYIEVMEYSAELAKKIDNRIPIPKDSSEENEIRANTISAVHELSMMLGLTSMDLNNYFWLAGQDIPEYVQYHLTEPRTTAY